MSSPASANQLIKSGHCYLADMNPPRKSKPGKTRPVVVIQSQDVLDAGSPGVVVIPCTTQLAKENILRVRLTPRKTLKLEKASDVLLDQIHTVDRSLILEELGSLTPDEYRRVLEGVRFLLDSAF